MTRPETRDNRPYGITDLVEPLADMLTTEEVASIVNLRCGIGVDVVRDYHLAEALVARLLDGTLTPHACGWDVELLNGAIRIEVKSAREYQQKSHAPRPVFKFALPRGGGHPKDSDVTVLVGVDGRDAVTTWAVPTDLLTQCASITLTAPRARLGDSSRSIVDSYRCPPSQLLPEVLRAARATAGMEPLL